MDSCDAALNADSWYAKDANGTCRPLFSILIPAHKSAVSPYNNLLSILLMLNLYAYAVAGTFSTRGASDPCWNGGSKNSAYDMGGCFNMVPTPTHREHAHAYPHMHTPMHKHKQTHAHSHAHSFARP
jgi:hypothetical protein